MSRIPHPVRGAYDYARTDIACPTCGAEPYTWCVQDGRQRHMPCIDRLEKRPDSEGPDTPPPVVRRHTPKGTPE